MRLTRKLAICSLGFAICLLAATAAAQPAASDPARDPRIRTTDRRLRQHLEEGIRRSLTFRSLVERLNQSDTVVYLQPDARPLPGVDGRLTFVAAHAGLRYVLVRIDASMSRCRQIAILGHELQHAVEIADTPSIVDSASLALAYAQFGYANQLTARSHASFDTKAAIRAGRDVMTELLGAGMSAD